MSARTLFCIMLNDSGDVTHKLGQISKTNLVGSLVRFWHNFAFFLSHNLVVRVLIWSLYLPGFLIGQNLQNHIIVCNSKTIGPTGQQVGAMGLCFRLWKDLIQYSKPHFENFFQTMSVARWKKLSTCVQTKVTDRTNLTYIGWIFFCYILNSIHNSLWWWFSIFGVVRLQRLLQNGNIGPSIVELP